MPFSQNFSVLQTPANPAYILLDDTSTGSDSAILSRKITITDCNGDYIVPTGTSTTYIAWALANDPISLNVLTNDVAVNIRVDWMDGLNGTGTVLYSLNNNYCLSEFSKQFMYYLVQLQSLNYNIIQDNNYWGNMGILWTNIIGAINAVEIGNDIFASQTCLNRVQNMITHQSYYF